MPLYNKKSQGLSLNVIVIAAIVLIVLIVLWAIFAGRIGGFSTELKRCRGDCKTEAQCKEIGGVSFPDGKQQCIEELTRTATGGSRIPFGDENPVCCVKLG